MAGRTTNYGWMKPEKNDYLEIDVISGVFEAIDEKMAEVEEAAGKSEGLDSHVANKNNPHGVTADQIGAATKGYVDNAIGSIPTPDVSGQIGEHNANAEAHAGMFAPMYSYGTADLTAGTSALETGKMYLAYE